MTYLAAMLQTKSLISLCLLFFCLSACRNEPVEEQSEAPKEPQIARFEVMGYTYNSPDGNKFLTETGNFPRPPFEIALNGSPQWVVGAPSPGGSTWVVAMEDGSISAYDESDGTAFPGEIVPKQLPAGMPPALAISARGQAQLLTAEGASPLSHPVAVGPHSMAWVDEAGTLWLNKHGKKSSLAVNALVDTRILTDGEGRLLLLADTASYHHAVLGDGLEAKSFVIVETEPELSEQYRVTLAHDAVIEGIAPIWVDFDGDGDREVITTVSNNQDGEGARLVVFSESGDLIADGNLSPPGWRHQLAVVPGPEGKNYIVDVQRPHVDMIVEFYYQDGKKLKVAASAEGFSSHIYPSRNLDMAVAADFDGDGQVETVLPNTDHTALRAVVLEGEEVKEVWSLDLGGEIATNLAAVPLKKGIALGVGNKNGRLRIWLP